MPRKGREICEKSVKTHIHHAPTYLTTHCYMEKAEFCLLFFSESHWWVLCLQLGSLIVYEEGSQAQYKNLVYKEQKLKQELMDFKKKSRIKHSL